MNIHNLSSLELSRDEINVLSKGLLFAPRIKPDVQSKIQLLRQFNMFATSLRRTYLNSQYYRTPQIKHGSNTTLTAKLYRPMKFLPKITYTSHLDRDSGIGHVEKYIDCSD